MMSDTKPDMEKTVSFDLDSNLYGAGLLVNVVAGAWIQSWYINWIKDQSIRFPDAAANNASEVWALETEEIKAWKNLSTATVGLYGLNWLLWAAGTSNGFDGSLVHTVFFFSL